MKPLNHILCVDDDEDILEIVKLSLELAPGLKVSCYGSGRAALEQIPLLKPDLVLLDVMMPQMDGPNTLARLRPLSDVPVIFLTARVQGEEVFEYLALGAIGVLAKPFDPMGLHDQISTIWQKAQAETAAS